MLICRSASLEIWTPDFSSSGQPDPTWTRALHGNSLLSNALNWVDWDESPIQVVLCDACGTTDCASGGYVHISKLADWILWTAPQGDGNRAESTVEEATSGVVRSYGAVAIPSTEWNCWRREAPDVPAVGSLAPTNGHALADAWRMSAVGRGRASRLDQVVPTLHQQLVASDSLGVEGVISAMERAVSGLEHSLDEAIHGRLAHPDSVGAVVETLYFDGPVVTGWPALALCNGRELLAFGSDCVFVPDAR